ncbi:MAG: DUF421 domain-containing protein [Gaiellaceae bacterium]
MDIVVRAIAAYVFIIFVLRIIGRRELSDLGPADVVLLVVMGDLVQNGVTQADDSVTGVFLAISTFALLTIAMSFVSFKSRRARRVIEGEPLILVQDGKPFDDNLRNERLDLDDIREEMRGQGIESLDSVKWCILESSGRMSFIKKSG